MSRRSLHIAALATAGLALFYVAVVGGIGGLDHLRRQAWDDWPWLLLILAGFGAQVGLYAELRRRRRESAGARATAGAGGGASALGMAACCAHHVVDLAPVVGLSGAAVFLTAYRFPIMIVGIAVNVVGVVLAVRRLRRVPDAPPTATAANSRSTYCPRK